MQVFHDHGRAPIKAWVDGVQVEDAARKQLENVASMPFIYKHVAAMPDVHWGLGATVGSGTGNVSGASKEDIHSR